MSDEHPMENTAGQNRDALPNKEAARRLLREAEPFLDLPKKERVTETASAETQPFRFEELSGRATRVLVDNCGDGDASIRLDIELGHAQLEPGEAAALAAGSLVSLNALTNEPVDIFADGRLVARGELVTTADQPGIRIVEVL